ncbi:sensor histidine kinase [Rhodobacter sp. CCP-1]|uniref:histidine kinase n=2 Tax=Paragemmobacter ruber TaxID=1985673 RepID=A0ABW9Y5B5_9RHOB|nr:sensor histidine kinase [Rhodobacter ruber]
MPFRRYRHLAGLRAGGGDAYFRAGKAGSVVFVRIGRGRFLNTLSGRFLLLTVAFVMLAEVLIFVPSIARFRADYMLLRLEKAQIASLALLAADDATVGAELETELLKNAEVFNVVLRRDEVRQLVLSSPIPAPIHDTFDLRLAGPWELIRDAMAVLADPENRVVRVIGNPVQDAGLLIEITMETGPLRKAMLEYGLRILFLSALISVVTAFLLFLATQRLLVVPIRRVVEHMTAYAEAPEDARRVIAPSAEVEELRVAEEALASMQTQLTGALRQKERLAQLGGAVAKISHDLRNILTTSQLFADRLGASADPAVARAAPKLVGSISRAVSLCESTLAFGKAEEPPPQLKRFALRTLVEDVIEGEGLAGEETAVAFLVDVPPGLVIRADSEQLYRVLSNLVRNARQAIEATGQPGTIEVSGSEDEQDWCIRVGDTGPGLPPRAKEHLFEAFQGGARKGGTGLGLAIAAELVRGHGGRLELARSDAEGTEFMIRLPKRLSATEVEAE